tara:strand:- start:164 stop:892 length:729 start_codon:yes stop_codon:yes gene_type:complete
MKLALDIGNTQIKLGIFEHLKLIHTECFQHNDNQNINLNYIKKFKPTVSIISSVVPNLTDKYVKNIYNILGLDSLIVNNENCHLDLKVHEPNTVGADRICNVIATIKIYNKPAIVIDFGTATTYDVINKNGQFIGGIIAPGIKTSSQYLIEKAALLDYVDFEFPKKVIGKNTEDNIKSGIMFGAIDQIEGMIKRINNETKQNNNIILTGGFSKLISPKISLEHTCDIDLTLKGMILIHESNN